MTRACKEKKARACDDIEERMREIEKVLRGQMDKWRKKIGPQS
jgi:hypothetical protein